MPLSLNITSVNLKKHDFAWTTYAYLVPADTPVQALMIPETWAHVAGQLRVGDRIDCMAIDGAFDCELRVVSKGDQYVKVRMLRYWDASEVPENAAPSANVEGYEVTWGGPNGKWRVMGPTKEVVPSLTGFASKEDAEGAMTQYLKQLAA